MKYHDTKISLNPHLVSECSFDHCFLKYLAMIISFSRQGTALYTVSSIKYKMLSSFKPLCLTTLSMP